MKKTNLRKWLVVVVSIPLLSVLLGLPVMAWGPYSQAVIADRAAEALGTPKGTAGLDYLNATVVAKAWEFTDRSYAKLDSDFTFTMTKIAAAGPALPQVRGWGSTQVADQAGDLDFFDQAAHPYDRWLLELMVDANLMGAGGEPGSDEILQTLGVTSRPELLSGTSKFYCQGRKVDAPFSAQYALQRSEMQALAMIAERVIMADEIFLANAAENAPSKNYKNALNASVTAVIDYLAFEILTDPGPAPEIGVAVADLPLQLLSKIGSILTMNGDAVISLTVTDGAARYKIDIVTERCNEITRTFLAETSADEAEHPEMRRLAGMLLDAMTPAFGARSYVDY